MTTETDIDLKIRKLSEALHTSCAALQGGQPVDLKGLDVEVGKVCELVGGLDKQEGRRYLPQLNALAETLDKLGDDLREAFAAEQSAR